MGGKHDGGLDGTGVNAVGLLLRREQPVRMAEAEPGAGDREHVQAHAQISRDQVHGRDIAAVAVGDHELAQAGTMHALAELDQNADHSLGR